LNSVHLQVVSANTGCMSDLIEERVKYADPLVSEMTSNRYVHSITQGLHKKAAIVYANYNNS
jgi:hypothetical protein